MEHAQNEATKATIRFRAKLCASNPGSSSAALELPEGLGLPWNRTTVEGIINTFPFRAPIEPNGKGYVITIDKPIQDAARAPHGEDVAVEITRVGEEAEIRVPSDFRKALEESPIALETWTGTTPMARREWVLFLINAKQEETRKKRIEKACDMLAHGKRRVCCFPGLNWLTKDHPNAETWLPLPGSKAKI